MFNLFDICECPVLLKPDDDQGEEKQKLDQDGKNYLDKLTQALKKNQKIPYKPRVQGWNRDKVVPSGSQDAVQRMSTAAPDKFTEEPEYHAEEDLQPASRTPMPVSRTPMPVNPNQTPPPDQRRSSGSVPRPNFTHHAPVGTFPMGTILQFEDKSIAVYKDVRPGKDYEVVLLLNPDGSVTAQGVALETYEMKAIGFLTPEFVLRMQRRKVWERDEIIFHLNAYDYCSEIPFPSTFRQTPMARPSQILKKPNLDEPESSSDGSEDKVPAATSKEEVKNDIATRMDLQPGRRFTISFGPGQEWQAVYWGEDDLGTVIVHTTNDKWSLMHMDLSRFEDSLVLGEMIDKAELDKIHSEVTH